MEKVSIKIKGKKVEITIPDAEIQETGISTDISKEDIRIIENSDALINKNKITSQDKINAVYEAQDKMKSTVSKNKALLNSSKERAKELIGNYIKELGKASNVEYEIVWKEYKE